MKKTFTLLILQVIFAAMILALTLVPVKVETASGPKDLTYATEFFDLWNSVQDYTHAKVINVVDGDTLLVSIDGVETTLRLIGIDTPETVHPPRSRVLRNRGLEPRQGVLSDKEIIIADWNPTDVYGRTLAYVWLEVEYGFKQYIMYNLLRVINGYGRAYLAFAFDENLWISSPRPRTFRELSLSGTNPRMKRKRSTTTDRFR